MFLVHEEIVTPAQKLVEFVFIELLVMRIDYVGRYHGAIPRSFLDGIVAATLMYVTCPMGQLTR
jgi:hypothetical protein